MSTYKTVAQIEKEFIDSGWRKEKLTSGSVLVRPLSERSKSKRQKSENGSSSALKRIRNRIVEVVWGY